jgi:hypothetical protein
MNANAREEGQTMFFGLSFAWAVKFLPKVGIDDYRAKNPKQGGPRNQGPLSLGADLRAATSGQCNGRRQDAGYRDGNSFRETAKRQGRKGREEAIVLNCQLPARIVEAVSIPWAGDPGSFASAIIRLASSLGVLGDLGVSIFLLLNVAANYCPPPDGPVQCPSTRRLQIAKQSESFRLFRTSTT